MTETDNLGCVRFGQCEDKQAQELRALWDQKNLTLPRELVDEMLRLCTIQRFVWRPTEPSPAMRANGVTLVHTLTEAGLEMLTALRADVADGEGLRIVLHRLALTDAARNGKPMLMAVYK